MRALICSISIGILFAVLVGGCGSSGSDISLVKNGTMQGYEKTTVGKAFEATFDSPKWESVKGSKGERIVRFTGAIPKTLHDSVVKGIIKGLSIEKFVVFESAVKKYGGENGSLVQNLNQKYGCQGVEPTPGVDNGYRPKCNDPDTSFKYMDEAIESFLVDRWKIGEPVQVDWIVRPDGKSFELSAMGSPAWGGLPSENILAEIYK